MGLARELAERIVKMQYRDLSEEAVHWGKIAVLDTMGVTLAGSKEDTARLLDEVVAAPSGGTSLVFGSDRRVGALDAALVNGTAAHALDFDNTASNIGGHISAIMVPALIAAAEAHSKSGEELLLAHAAGFQAGRIGLALNPLHTEKGWHPTSTLGVFAVTAACARLLGLTVDQTETALALATSLAAGTKANFGTMTKPLHSGQCARGGLMAALLARKGFTANPDAFEHKQGFLALFSDGGRHDVSRVFESWGETLEIVSPGAGYKLYPCCYSTHSAIQGALSLVKEHGVFDPDAIERVESRTSARGLAHTDRANPRSNLEAKFSVQYCVARALTSGKVLLEHFDGQSHEESAVQAVLAKTHASPYTGPFYSEDRLDARLKVVMKDGRVLEAKVDLPLGRGTKHPIPTEALDAKFRDCALRVLSPQQADSVLKQLWALDSLADVNALTKMLETRGGAPLQAAA